MSGFGEYFYITQFIDQGFICQTNVSISFNASGSGPAEVSFIVSLLFSAIRKKSEPNNSLKRINQL